jgi:heat shock protein HslJ
LNPTTRLLRTLTRRPALWLAAPLFLALQACSSSATPAPNAPAPLWGTQWQLAALGAQAVMPQSRATLQFPEVGRVTGNGSCNRFSAAVTVRQDRLTFGDLASTKMACIGGAMAQETAYMAALQKAQRFERQGDSLLIHVQGLAQPLRFTAAP